MRAGVWVIVGLSAVGGCASTRARDPRTLAPGSVAFEKVGVLDFRRDTVDDYRRMVRPGDLIVNYMRPGRAAKKREWLFAILPNGHSMIVLDPADPQGIIECRFHGMRRVGPEELGLYSYNTVYRLTEPERLNLPRLIEFADLGCQTCRKYSFKSWLTLNDNLTPAAPELVSDRYTCSTMVVAAYHYAGLTLDVSDFPYRIITPVSVAASVGRWNASAIPAPHDTGAH